MKRVDVLKGIESILVQKAYETGHISHRADGDWQKQADGSWKPYKGQSAQNPNKKDRYGFSLLPDEDKQGYLDRANGDPYQAQILYEKDVENSPMGGLDEEEDQYDEITEEDLDESYGDDEVDYTYAKDIDYSQYDDDIKSIEFRENDDGEFEPHGDDYFRVADKIYEQTNREDMSDEEADRLYDGIVDRVIDRAYELHNNVQKSAVRDMRSAPATKNMGF